MAEIVGALLPSGFVSTLSGRQVTADASGDPSGGGLDRVPCQMRVSGGSLNLGMAEQLAE